MAFNGMSSVPSVSQRTLAITATQFSSFATPAITVPFPSVYAGQTQIPFAFSGTATWAATRVPTTIGGVAATAGVHSINSEASAAGYRTHDYGNGGGGGGWPTWATAVIAACGGTALILGILGLYCWRLRRKQKARKRAAAVYAHGDEGKKRRRMTKQGAAYTEKAVPARDSQRRSRAGVAAGSHPRSGRTSISPSQSRKRGPQYDYPPPIHTQLPDSPSNIRSRDLAALGISRPTSAAPSARRQREQDLASHPNAYPSDAPVYPQFAVPRSSRDFSGSSQNGLLAAGAPFAYQEGDTRLSRHSTPPPRAPNTAWGEYDSPGQNGSPAHLLARGDGYGSAEQDTPRSSLTMSTRGTGGAPYRWDQDPDLSSHMPDAGAVSAALGRAMLGPGSVAHEQPVGLAYGSPDDAHWANDSYGSSAHGYGGGHGQDLRRSRTPSYPPPASTSATSRAPSRQAQLDSGRASTYVPSHDGHRLQAPPGQQRSTTPLDEPFPSTAAGGAGVLGAPVAYGGGGRAEHGRTDSAASASGRSRNYSRASTYETAAESDLEDDGYATPSRAYAR